MGGGCGCVEVMKGKKEVGGGEGFGGRSIVARGGAVMVHRWCGALGKYEKSYIQGCGSPVYIPRRRGVWGRGG